MPSSTSSSEPRPRGRRFLDADVVEREIPPLRWGRAAAIALAFALVALVSWEARMRGLQLEPGDIDDGNGHWAVERRKLDHADARSVAIVGDSRILFDTDLDLFGRMTGQRPIQLALPGTSGRHFLEDVAQNSQFSGLLIVGIAEVSYFREKAGLMGGVLDYVRTESPSQRLGHKLYLALSRVFAFVDNSYRLSTLIATVKLPEREKVRGPYLGVWKLSNVYDDRQSWLWQRIETDARLRTHARLVWNDFKGDPLTDEIIKSTIARTRKAVATIRARGGDVVFVRPPSAGPVRVNEELRAPRAKVWEALLREAGVAGVHFEDVPAMQGLVVPEYSHLNRESARVFTRAMAEALAAKTTRVTLR